MSSAAAGEWRYCGADAESTKYSPLDEITFGNIQGSRHRRRWGSSDNAIVGRNPATRPVGYQDTPIMVDGMLCTTTSLGVYAAIDLGTGRTPRQHDPEIWRPGRPPNLGFTHRGTAYWSEARRSGSSAARTTRT